MSQEIQKHQDLSPVQIQRRQTITERTNQTIKLVGCLVPEYPDDITPEKKKEIEDDKPLIISAYALKLMPKGVPDFSTISEYPSIIQVRNEYGDEKAMRIVKSLIENFNLSINVVRPMTSVQLNECAFMMLSDYSSYRLEDFVIMFSMAKKGELGRILDRIDISTISGFLSEYDKLRSQYSDRKLDEYTQFKETEFVEPKNPVEFDVNDVINKLKKESISSKENYIKNISEKSKFTLEECAQINENYIKEYKNHIKNGTGNKEYLEWLRSKNINE